MKHTNPWQLTNEFRSIVLKSTSKPKTLWEKLRKVINENEDIFKNSDALIIYNYRLEEFSRYERCFKFLKSGFFKREGLAGYYLISEITKFNSYLGGTFDMKLKDGSIYTITEQDYNDLEILLK